MDGKEPHRFRKWANLLLLVPVVAVLCVPIYNFDEPRVLGIPYFYVWQITWIGLGAAMTWLVYTIARKGRDT